MILSFPLTPTPQGSHSSVMCLSWGFHGCDKTLWSKVIEERIYFRLYLLITAHHWSQCRNPNRAEIENQELKQRPCIGLLPLTLSQCFLKQLRATCPGVVPFTGKGRSHIDHPLRKYLTGQSGVGIVSNEAPFSQMTLAYIKLNKQTNT